MASFDFAALTACLRLTPDADGSYVGKNLPLDYHRVFGGQILAQTLVALDLADEGKQVKSFVQRFPREGDAGVPLTYSVAKLQDGRTFGSYDVAVSQNGKLVSACAASMHVPEQGWERQDPAPDVAAPDASVETPLDMVPWEVRVAGGTDLAATGVAPARYSFWMRAPAPTEHGLADRVVIHQALLAHATDLTLIGTSLLGVDGLSQHDTGTRFHSAVTTHAMWFHRPFTIDEWLLVDQVAPVMAEGRSFGRGDVWTAAGQLVASFAQEAMVRPLPQG
jgi:acyl-CoA thioesterase-2